jgi:hypothetical protein
MIEPREELKMLMCTPPGEETPPQYWERFDVREPEPDALVVGTTEPCVRCELIA